MPRRQSSEPGPASTPDAPFPPPNTIFCYFSQKPGEPQRIVAAYTTDGIVPAPGISTTEQWQFMDSFHAGQHQERERRRRRDAAEARGIAQARAASRAVRQSANDRLRPMVERMRARGTMSLQAIADYLSRETGEPVSRKRVAKILGK